MTTPSLSPSRRGRPQPSPSTSTDALAARGDRLLRARAIAARRAFLTAGYAPTDLTWLGVPVPAIRDVVRDCQRATREQPPVAVLQLALALARTKVIESRQVGYELLGRRTDALSMVDRSVAERLGRGNDNWAVVDAFATSVTGPAWRLGHLDDHDILAWARSTDLWWRRTALVSTVVLNTASRGGTADSRRTLLICRAVLSDVTPMIGKALSWALRALAPHDPGPVLAFLKRHRARLPTVVVREVRTKVEVGTKRRPARSVVTTARS